MLNTFEYRQSKPRVLGARLVLLPYTGGWSGIYDRLITAAEISAACGTLRYTSWT